MGDSFFGLGGRSLEVDIVEGIWISALAETVGRGMLKAGASRCIASLLAANERDLCYDYGHRVVEFDQIFRSEAELAELARLVAGCLQLNRSAGPTIGLDFLTTLGRPTVTENVVYLYGRACPWTVLSWPLVCLSALFWPMESARPLELIWPVFQRLGVRQGGQPEVPTGARIRSRGRWIDLAPEELEFLLLLLEAALSRSDLGISPQSSERFDRVVQDHLAPPSSCLALEEFGEGAASELELAKLLLMANHVLKHAGYPSEEGIGERFFTEHLVRRVDPSSSVAKWFGNGSEWTHAGWTLAAVSMLLRLEGGVHVGETLQRGFHLSYAMPLPANRR